jgi:hypothetical protein
MINYLRRFMSGGAGYGMGTTIKDLRDAAGISLGTTAKYLRCATSAAAGSGLSTKAKYLVNLIAGAGSNFAKAHYKIAGHEFCCPPL